MSAHTCNYVCQAESDMVCFLMNNKIKLTFEHRLFTFIP